MPRPQRQSTASFRATLPRVAGLAAALWCALPAPAHARQLPRPTGANTALADQKPAELDGVGIADKAGTQLPGDVVLRDGEGREVRLDGYFDGRRPVVLALAYYSCPMLCTLVLNGMNDGLKEVAWTAGEEYRVVTVSIDPRDTAEIAKAKQASYVEEYGRRVTDDAWTFLTGDEDQVKRLADAVGFTYRWDEPSQQYVHAAGVFVLTPEGRVSRTLYGIEFKPRDLRMAITEASEGRIGSAIDQVLMFCFHYDPQSKGYVVAATRVMRAGGLLTVLILAGVVGRFWRRERLRAMSPQES